MVTTQEHEQESRPILFHSNYDAEAETVTYDTPEPWPQRTAFSEGFLERLVSDAPYGEGIQVRDDPDGQVVIIVVQNGRAAYRLDAGGVMDCAQRLQRIGTLLHSKWEPTAAA